MKKIVDPLAFFFDKFVYVILVSIQVTTRVDFSQSSVPLACSFAVVGFLFVVLLNEIMLDKVS